MKILGIAASPVKAGNNDQIIDYALKRPKDKGFAAEKISLASNEVKGCIACDLCKDKKGECSIKDAMAKINKKLIEADAIIVSSPVYFGTISSQLKALFDRTLTLRRDSFKLKNKLGAAIAVGRSRNGGQEYAIYAIHCCRQIHGMIVVGDNNHFGGIVVSPFDKDEVGKRTVDDTVDKVCEVLSMVGKD